MLTCSVATLVLIATQLTNPGPLRLDAPIGAGPAVQQAHLLPVTDLVAPSELSAHPDQSAIVCEMPSLPDLLDQDLPTNLPAQSNLATAASGLKQEAASSEQEIGEAQAAADIKQEAASSQQKAVQPPAAAGIKQEAASSQQEGAHGQAAQGQSAGGTLPPLPRLSAQSTAVQAPSYVPEKAGMDPNARSGPAAAASAAAVPAAAVAGSSGMALLPRSGPVPAMGTPAGSYAAGSTPAPASLSCQAPAGSQATATWTPAGSSAMFTQRQGQGSAPDRVPQQASQQQWRPQAPAWGGSPGLMPYQRPPAVSVTPASGGRGMKAQPWGGLQTPSQQGWQRPVAPYGAGAGFGGLGMGRLGMQGMRTVTRVSGPERVLWGRGMARLGMNRMWAVTRVSWLCCRTALGAWTRAVVPVKGRLWEP